MMYLIAVLFAINIILQFVGFYFGHKTRISKDLYIAELEKSNKRLLEIVNFYNRN